MARCESVGLRVGDEAELAAVSEVLSELWPALARLGTLEREEQPR